MKKLIVGLMLLISGSANAGLITLSSMSTSVDGGSITYSNLIAPSTTFSDAIFTLMIAGDFDNNDASESVTISIDGFSLGTIFDNNVHNDLFNFASDDYVGSHSNMVFMTGQATISQATWASIIADGLISITFNLSSGVNCCSDPHAFTSGSIAYTSTVANTVSATSSLALALLGVAGIALRRQRKATA